MKRILRLGTPGEWITACFMLCLGIFLLFGANTGCKKKPANDARRVEKKMYYFKDTKSKQCFAVSGKRMAWVPCSAVKDHLVGEDEVDDNDD